MKPHNFTEGSCIYWTCIQMFWKTSSIWVLFFKVGLNMNCFLGVVWKSSSLDWLHDHFWFPWICFFCFFNSSTFFLLFSDEGPALPTKQNEEFRPFIRRLPEFKFWWVPKCTRDAAPLVFIVLWVPVYWQCYRYNLSTFSVTEKSSKDPEDPWSNSELDAI